MWATGVTNIRRRGVKAETPEVDALRGMHRMADYLRSPNLGCLIGYSEGTPGILMLSPVVAKAMAAIGWTKQSIREFLWEHSKIPADELRRDGIDSWIAADRDTGGARESVAAAPGRMPCVRENLVLLVAGGGHPTNSYWMEGYSPHVVGRPIDTPKDFTKLLVQAERDIGCGAEACRI